MGRDRRGVEADAGQQPEQAALAAALLRGADREVREDPERAVAPRRERPRRDPERRAALAQDDIAGEEVGEGIERARDRPGLAGGEPPDGELAAHRRRPGLGVAEPDPLGEPVRPVGLAGGRDHHQGVVGRQAVPEHAVHDVLRGMEDPDRLGPLEEVERGRLGAGGGGVLAGVSETRH